MNILLLLIPLSLVLIGIVVWLFAWAVRNGQFEDLDTPALDVLLDDKPAPAPAAGAPSPPPETASHDHAD